MKEPSTMPSQQGWQRIFLGGESAAPRTRDAGRAPADREPGKPALIGMLFPPPESQSRVHGDRRGSEVSQDARETTCPFTYSSRSSIPKYLHSQALAEQLQTGGSAVYLHYLQGRQGWFHVRVMPID